MEEARVLRRRLCARFLVEHQQVVAAGAQAQRAVLATMLLEPDRARVVVVRAFEVGDCQMDGTDACIGRDPGHTIRVVSRPRGE